VILLKIIERLGDGFIYYFVFLVFFMTGCAGSANKLGYITNKELSDLVKAENAPIVLDARSSWEYEKGHVPGAIHVPFWIAYFEAERISRVRSQPVVVYCEHGPRAGIAKFGLYLAGFENVIYLRGHMAQWKQAGFAIER